MLSGRSKIKKEPLKVKILSNFLNIKEEKIVANRQIWAKVAKPPSPEIEMPVTNTINKNELNETKMFV